MKTKNEARNCWGSLKEGEQVVILTPQEIGMLSNALTMMENDFLRRKEEHAQNPDSRLHDPIHTELHARFMAYGELHEKINNLNK